MSRGHHTNRARGDSSPGRGAADLRIPGRGAPCWPDPPARAGRCWPEPPSAARACWPGPAAWLVAALGRADDRGSG